MATLDVKKSEETNIEQSRTKGQGWAESLISRVKN